jgi:large-conductance mechanosensitive channel
MSLPMTNEQKLDAIYILLQKQDSRERRAFWYNLLKRVIIYGAILFVALNPTVILGYMTDLIMPRVMDAMTQALDKQETETVDGLSDTKAALMQKIRDQFAPAQTEGAQY